MQQAKPNAAGAPVFLPSVHSGADTSAKITDAQAVRFLAQAGFGATPEDTGSVKRLGYDEWLNKQLAKPISTMRPYLATIETDVTTNNPPYDTVPYARPRDNKFALSANLSTVWMRNLIGGQDQLRQRMAWCLSQIFVVSFNSVNKLSQGGVAMADYYDMLSRNALGSFRALLAEVTLHPAMSYFLSSLGNEKADPANNQYPDENYAREVMQLFTIGLWDLGMDGEQVRDSKGNPIPSYDTRDVEEMARVFTGFWFKGKPWPNTDINFPPKWLSDYPLAIFEDKHDQAEKTLFHGKAWQKILPANKGGKSDVDAAVDALVNHPNTAPFISKALIKFLVTSNPSTAYVTRVAQVFANNGKGVHGDLFAVAKAILLDPDARSESQLINVRHGKLQEPLVRLARLVRAFKAGKDQPNLQYWGNAGPQSFLQWVLYSPSVFNFFAAGYRHLGTLAKNGLVSPEFQILNSVSVATTSNLFATYIDTVLHARLLGNTPTFAFDFTYELTLADNATKLTEWMNTILCNGQMSTTTRQNMLDGINSIAVADKDKRVRFAVWMAAVSPEAAVLR